MKKIVILGAGSWATGLARILTDNEHCVTLWGRNRQQIEHFKATNCNIAFMPEQKLVGDVHYTTDLNEALKTADFVVNAVPTQHVREVLSKKPPIPEAAVIVNAAKGLEVGSNLRISEIVKEYYPNHSYAVLSGPSHAEEVVKRMPTTLVAASYQKSVALAVQALFMCSYARIYAHADVKGVELCGALKNVIAISAGICDGLGFGDNTLAALMTRGIVEMKRLGQAMGAQVHTFDGLAGIGDLIVTCMSNHSRNRRCGQLIGRGYNLEAAVAEIGAAVEGVWTIKAAEFLRKAHQVEMPIVEQLYKVLYQSAAPQDAVKLLMDRESKVESEFQPETDVWQ
ncbi:MAG: glycerol-3-phosphate dehydrogenase [Clostridiales bacterium]|nr:MAG: glycerol-3-phosphate dehydrogenase [Clostridiales bacterium]